MDLHGLRRQCRTLLLTLGVASPLDPHDLADKLSASRGRPVRLVHRTGTFGSFGCVIPMPTEDLIVYHANSTAELNQVVFHEIAHVFLEHLSPSSGEESAALMCGFDAEDTAAGAGAKTLYENTAEWEAESAATILSEWSTVTPGQSSSGDPDSDPVLGRLTRAFDDVRGWR